MAAIHGADRTTSAGAPARGLPGADAQRPPSLGELMPWAAPLPRTGREWVLAPDPSVLRRRWERLTAAGPEERRQLFAPTRARTADSAAAQLPGRDSPTGPVAREPGPCPAPVRVRRGGFDRPWLLADQRLLDTPRPELWRVADGEHQMFLTVSAQGPSGVALSWSAELPVAAEPQGRGTALVRPLFRRPEGREPNLAPGLTELIAARLTESGGGSVPPVTALDVAAWTAALTLGAAPQEGGAGGEAADDPPVPLTADPALWQRGLALGRRLLWLHTFGARCADPQEDRPPGPPRLPGGRRPYVRQAVRGMPDTLTFDPEAGALLLGPEGRISPVPAAAWEPRTGDGERVLESWFAARGGAAAGSGPRRRPASPGSAPRDPRAPRAPPPASPSSWRSPPPGGAPSRLPRLRPTRPRLGWPPSSRPARAPGPGSGPAS
ncbi:type ISP restriction/modification enzyme [Phaeacidiphilus oryzae]|uniref:type ISP restriction/modification enzyme n=1 Tax=Phaeacidiphilus oryzae TaxID=348818 RepID=UPI00069132C8|nr:type ISP restriction/modification enzyme [Phaeacidiphilus oryzae]